MSKSRPSPIATVVSQHAEEAAFLWLLRDLAVHEAHYSLKDLADLDDRVEAHIDGLRIAGEPGWEILRQELGWQEPGEVFAAAALAYESGDPLRLEEVLATGSESSELARGVISALGWLPIESAKPHFDQLLESEYPIRQRMGVGAMAVHRHNPGSKLAFLVLDAPPPARARALKAAGELGRSDLASHCRTALDADDEEVRYWAAWSTTLLGDQGASRVLFALAQEEGPRGERTADLFARRMPPSGVLAWQRQLSEDSEKSRLACRVAGALGDPVLVPWLIEMMAIDDVARPAGEAFSWITGIDLAYDDLERDWPEGFEAGPTESPEDEDVELDSDENLPWPDPELIADWWKDSGSGFAPGTRYLLGLPISRDNLWHVVRTGMQRQRSAAALELALLGAGEPLFEVRARGDRQRRLLGV